MRTWLKNNWLLLLTHLGALAPISLLLIDFLGGRLSVNPIQDITLRTGRPAIVLLALTLAVTPLNNILGLRQAVRSRRWLGLYAFGYVSIHFLIFVGLDYGLSWPLIKEAIFEKRYALIGFATGLTLIPLALTSTRASMRRLGKGWKKLHRLVYLAGGLAAFHYIWVVKSDIRLPLVYAGVIALLLLMRLPPLQKFLRGLRPGFRRLLAR